MAEGEFGPTGWLQQLLARRPDLAAASGPADAGFLHLASRLLLPLGPSADMLPALVDEVRGTEPLPDLGVLLAELRPGVDLTSILARIPEASPVHVFAVPEAIAGPESFHPVRVTSPPEPGPVSREVTVAVLDTGIVAYPWFTSRPWWERVQVSAFDEPGSQVYGHGAFLCGLVLQQEPAATLLPVQVVDGDGLVDELTLARAIQEIAGAAEIAVVPVAGYTWNNRPPGVLTRALAVARARGVVVLAPLAQLPLAGWAVDDRPVFPAALSAVYAVDPAQLEAVSSFPDIEWASTGILRGDEASFRSALLAGSVATGLLGGASDAQEALQWAIASAMSVGSEASATRTWSTYQPLPPNPLDEPHEYLLRERRSLLSSAVYTVRGIGSATAAAAAWASTLLRRPLGRSREPAGVMAAYRYYPTVAADSPRQAVAPPGRIVSTGFAVPASPGNWLPPTRTLAADTDYIVLFKIGDAQHPEAIDEPDAPPIPLSATPAGTRLRVLLFGFPEGLAINPEADIGELIIDGDGRIRTARQPGRPSEDSHQDYPLDEPLRFPVRTGAPGVQQLRCSVYLDTKLLQSRVISALVTMEPTDHVEALRAAVDYTLTRELNPASLAELITPRLSVMINDGAAGTHDFRFVGEGDFKGDARLDADLLHTTLTNARSRLRQVAWNTPNEWTTSDVYRYKSPRPHSDLVADLIWLARSGYRIWYALAENLARSAGNEDGQPISREGLQRLMRKPGSVEFCSRQSVRLMLPTAVVYDAPLDSNSDDLTLCPDFDDALRHGLDLLSLPCLQGDCPSLADIQVVCPSGFWGFRHEIGLPVTLQSLGSGATEAAAVIPGADNPSFLVGVTTDPTFVRLAGHLNRLQALHVPVIWDIGKTRGELLEKMQAASPHIVYFLCHGAESDGLPALVVGDPEHPYGITPDNLEAYGIAWRQSRPLVVLNGCQTAALDPTKPLNFVEAFTSQAFASGVVGTEISVFEELACDFALEMLRRFIADDVPLGRAVREARLALLKDGNPLGLVYIPFGSVGLRMGAAS